VEYDRAESKSSGVVEVKAWGNQQIVHDKTDEPLADYEYVLVTGEGKYIIGKTDASGYIKHTCLQIGDFYLAR
jgi:uncharacterized protein (DUF2345 family)